MDEKWAQISTLISQALSKIGVEDLNKKQEVRDILERALQLANEEKAKSITMRTKNDSSDNLFGQNDGTSLSLLEANRFGPIVAQLSGQEKCVDLRQQQETSIWPSVVVVERNCAMSDSNSANSLSSYHDASDQKSAKENEILRSQRPIFDQTDAPKSMTEMTRNSGITIAASAADYNEASVNGRCGGLSSISSSGVDACDVEWSLTSCQTHEFCILCGQKNRTKGEICPECWRKENNPSSYYENVPKDHSCCRALAVDAGSDNPNTAALKNVAAECLQGQNDAVTQLCQKKQTVRDFSPDDEFQASIDKSDPVTEDSEHKRRPAYFCMECGISIRDGDMCQDCSGALPTTWTSSPVKSPQTRDDNATVFGFCILCGANLYNSGATVCEHCNEEYEQISPYSQEERTSEMEIGRTTDEAVIANDRETVNDAQSVGSFSMSTNRSFEDSLVETPFCMFCGKRLDYASARCSNCWSAITSKAVSAWTSDEVAMWLSLCLVSKKCLDAFVEQDIDGMSLRAISQHGRQTGMDRSLRAIGIEGNTDLAILILELRHLSQCGVLDIS